VIRIVIIASLTALLVLVLYLPSAYPAQRFFAQLRTEHTQLAASWDSARAERILPRSIETQAATTQRVPVPGMRDAPPVGAIHNAVAGEMAAVNARLFDSPYFRALDALLLLASYRVLVMLEWLPWLAPFAVAAMVDAIVVRSIKATQFGHHNPEAFAACAAGAVLLACGMLVTFVLPTKLSPLTAPAMLTALAGLVTGAVRNFHRRA
jgi:hypothetical protein